MKTKVIIALGLITLLLSSCSKEVNGNDEHHATNDNEQSLLNISSPVIQDITYSTAVVKGSVLGENIKFQDRGLCYSTSRTPTVEDTKVSHNNNIIDKTITDLFVGTTYYVRLYAKIDDKYYYGEETSFTTNGNRVSKIIFKDIEETSDLTNSQIKISALLPNEIENYGVCYGKSPHPKITDNYVEEAYRQTEWTLPKLECGYEYYVRAYHIEGTNIIYYEDSETKITPVTKEQIQYKLDTINKRDNFATYSLLVTLNGLPDGVYEVDIEIYRLKFSDQSDNIFNRDIDNQKKYVEIINNKASTDFSGELYSSYNSEFYISHININAVDNDDVRRISIKRSL